MKCNNCGNEVQSGFVCPYCGNQLNATVQSNMQIQNNVQQSQMNSNQNFANTNNLVNNSVVSPVVPTKKRNYIPIISILCAILVILCLCLCSKYFNNSSKTINESGTRTLMLYVVGSTLEEENGSATSDIKEIIDSNFDEENLNVLIYTGGTRKWGNSSISSGENAIYEVKNGSLNKVIKYDQKDMSNYSTLEEFISYVYDNYHTDLYDLVLWDHGGGPVIGYGSDTNYDEDIMPLNDLITAIKTSSLGKSTKFEFVGFDACLMSSVEIAYALRNYSSYLVASEESIPGYGWDYSFLSNVKSSTTSKELTQYIVDKYFTFYSDLKEEAKIYKVNYDPSLTLAVTDLSKVDDLVNSIDDLFKNLDGEISVSNYSKFSQEFSKATLYGYQGSDDNSFDLVDLYGLLE